MSRVSTSRAQQARAQLALGNTPVVRLDSARSAERAQATVRAGCLLGDLALARELARRAERQLHGLRLEVLESPDQLALTEEPTHESHDLIVVDACHADASVERLLSLGTTARPELILVGLPALRALRLRMRGLPLALEVPDTAGCDAIVDAIRRVVAVHLPTRLLVQQLVGRVDLPTALTILRYHMMTSALARTGTKRATAKLLGVSRPAVQQMLKSLAPASPTPEAGRGRYGSHVSSER